MTRPLVSTFTVAASVASVLPPIEVGSTYAQIPTPRYRPSARAASCSLRNAS